MEMNQFSEQEMLFGDLKVEEIVLLEVRTVQIFPSYNVRECWVSNIRNVQN